MFIFIINPIAGNGRAKKIHQQLKNRQEYTRLNPHYYYTQYKGHAEELAAALAHLHRDALSGFVVIGGDGTMNEVVNGLKDQPIPLSFIPGGSGNDFARGADLLREPLALLQALFLSNKTTAYWPGSFEADRSKRTFLNCVGFGFDAVVTDRANRSKLKKLCNQLHVGAIGYVLALIRELIFYKPISITMELDEKKMQFDNCFMITINNHPYFGGGMKINPSARHQPELLSVLVIHNISKWKVFALFGTVFTGKHLAFKEVETFTAKQINISSNDLLPYQMDGETGHTMHAVLNKKQQAMKIQGSRQIEKTSEKVTNSSIS